MFFTHMTTYSDTAFKTAWHAFGYLQLPFTIKYPCLKLTQTALIPCTFTVVIDMDSDPIEFWRKMHTCDKFLKGIREIFLSFQGGLWKMYRIYKKILHSDEGDFKIWVKSGILKKTLNFRELPADHIYENEAEYPHLETLDTFKHELF